VISSASADAGSTQSRDAAAELAVAFLSSRLRQQVDVQVDVVRHFHHASDGFGEDTEIGELEA
jgi:hypothetical protein